jgi:hypothetical protein
LSVLNPGHWKLERAEQERLSDPNSGQIALVSISLSIRSQFDKAMCEGVQFVQFVLSMHSRSELQLGMHKYLYPPHGGPTVHSAQEVLMQPTVNPPPPHTS